MQPLYRTIWRKLFFFLFAHGGLAFFIAPGWADPGGDANCTAACANDGETEICGRTPWAECTRCMERVSRRKSKTDPPSTCCLYCPVLGPPFECGSAVDEQKHDCHELCAATRSCMRSQCPAPPAMAPQALTSISITCGSGMASGTLTMTCPPGKIVLGCNVPEPTSSNGCLYDQGNIGGNDGCNPNSDSCITCRGPLLSCDLQWQCNCSGGEVICGDPLPTPTPTPTATATATATPTPPVDCSGCNCSYSCVAPLAGPECDCIGKAEGSLCKIERWRQATPYPNQ